MDSLSLVLVKHPLLRQWRKAVAIHQVNGTVHVHVCCMACKQQQQLGSIKTAFLLVPEEIGSVACGRGSQEGR